MTYLQSEINAIVERNDGFICPDVIKKIQHGPTCLVPDKSIVSLEREWEQQKDIFGRM